MEPAAELGKKCKNKTASNELCRLVVLNTASLQLIPATIAAVRASLGAKAPFDILPAVWIASLASLITGIFSAILLEKLSAVKSRRRKELIERRKI